jgi:TonB family protein
VEPALTPVASRARITATVTVAVIVNEKGEVYEARVRKGHPLLDRSALSAVLQWKFEPMVVDGAPRAFVATIDLYFHP